MNKKKNKSIISPQIGLRLTIYALLILLLGVIIKSAWLCDDAYISFRYLKNLFDGYGLRWNIHERVQSFSNPLYLFSLIPLYFITDSIYFSSLLMSISMTMIGIFILVFDRKKSINIGIIIMLTILIGSKAFIDYSTSGLENPLTHLLVAIFYKIFFSTDEPYQPRQFLWLCIVASLMCLNRIDSIVLVIPALCYCFFYKISLKKTYYAILGFTPFILFLSFAFFYYGFIFPNTAYAKLNVNIDIVRKIKTGVLYIISGFTFGDYITVPAIASALIISILKRDKKLLLLGGGVLLYMIYILYIGGDFMYGRFLSAPVLLSAYIISRSVKLNTKVLAITSVIIMVIGSASAQSPLTSDIEYSRIDTSNTNFASISDERKIYYYKTGLVWVTRRIATDGDNPDCNDFSQSFDDDIDLSIPVIEATIGFNGYFSNSKLIIIDPLALGDPLLARISPSSCIRPGHYVRKIPLGYYESVGADTNYIEDESLSEYYDKLMLVVNGDIFDIQRLKTAIEMNIEKYDYLINEYEQREGIQ